MDNLPLATRGLGALNANANAMTDVIEYCVDVHEINSRTPSPLPRAKLLSS